MQLIGAFHDRGYLLLAEAVLGFFDRRDDLWRPGVAFGGATDGQPDKVSTDITLVALDRTDPEAHGLAEAILRGGLAKHSDAMPVKPARGVPEGCGGAEAINLVGCAERIFKPHGLEVEPADVRIGDRAGGAVRAR